MSMDGVAEVDIDWSKVRVPTRKNVRLCDVVEELRKQGYRLILKRDGYYKVKRDYQLH